jgi:hypothetical protein
VPANTMQEFAATCQLIASWPGGWYFEGKEPHYSVKALANLSSKGYAVGFNQQLFSGRVTNTVKNGGPALKALLVILARSFLISGVSKNPNLMWGIYPSSSSTNDDTEVLSEFTHSVRALVSSVRFAERGNPLFIRHTASPKRSTGGSSGRTPAGQIETIHLNQDYKDNIQGRNVVILDDCTTYGVSFGVSAALLRKAGAASVLCVALGKFGGVLNYYEIEIDKDPFSPILPGQYRVTAQRSFSGTDNPAVQSALIPLV